MMQKRTPGRYLTPKDVATGGQIDRLVTRLQAHLPRIKRDLDAREAAVDRMAGPEVQLRRLVAFTSQELGQLSRQERVTRGDDLRQILPRHWTWSSRPGPLADASLRRIHRILRRALHTLLIDRRSHQDGAALYTDTKAGWRLPRGAPRLIRISPQEARRTHFQLLWHGTEEHTILWGVAELLLTSGHRLRACPDCQTRFVANKRQAYCSLECSQKIRNLRKQERKRAEV